MDTPHRHVPQRPRQREYGFAWCKCVPPYRPSQEQRERSHIKGILHISPLYPQLRYRASTHVCIMQRRTYEIHPLPHHRPLSRRHARNPPMKSNQKSAHKWQQILGCLAAFDHKGILNIFQNATVIAMDRSVGEHLTFRIVQIKPRAIVFTSDGFQLSIVRKKFCKIV